VEKVVQVAVAAFLYNGYLYRLKLSVIYITIVARGNPGFLFSFTGTTPNSVQSTGGEDMKTKASLVTLVAVFLVVGLLIGIGSAEANVPRWPEPAWFAQFSQPTQPTQPTSAPAPAPAPQPQPTPPSTQPSSTTYAGWLSPEWFALYNSQANTAQPAQPAQSTPTVPGSSTGGQTQGHQLTAQELQLASLVNQERSQRGIRTLQIDQELSKWARIKSQDMVDNNYFAHQSPTYGKVSTMLSNAGVIGSYFGENLAMTSSVTRAHDLFMGSSIHRAQILNSGYTHVGIGIAYKGATLYVTQLFAAR
jgi:uncharacterized protein YkwD